MSLSYQITLINCISFKNKEQHISYLCVIGEAFAWLRFCSSRNKNVFFVSLSPCSVFKIQVFAKKLLTFRNIHVFMKGQIKKLFFNKHFVDTPGSEPSAEWRLSPWKIFFCLIAGFISLIILYAFLATPEPSDFLGNMLFYAIVIVGAIAVLWVAGVGAYKFRKTIAGFFIAFILILTVYWFLGFLLNHFNILSFHMGGWALWFMITILAGLGAKRIDGSLDRNDVGYGLLVFIICLGANIPVANGQGFLWNLDNLILQVLGWGSLVTNNLGLIFMW